MKFTIPKAVLFDWDNTLIISRDIMYQSLYAAMNKMNIDHDILKSPQFIESRHLSIRDSFPYIFGDNWEKVFEVYEEHFQSTHLQKVILMPQAKEFLEVANTYNLPMSIVSNKEGNYLRKEAKKLEVDKHFYNIIGSYDADTDKPSIAPVKAAIVGIIDQCDYDVWFIGDSIVDMKCAKNSGCLPILFGENEDEIAEAKKHDIAHLTVKDFAELKSIYLNLLK